MTRKTVLIDTSLCTGCNGCAVACKVWNELPAEKTQYLTSYQVHNDYTPNTWTYVTFVEKYEDQKMNWMMRKTQCFHCAEPSCMKACSSKAISQTDSGYVIINQDKCIGCGYCVENCPFGVPKVDPIMKKSFKCTGCIDRIENNILPACVSTCQTGALQFGERDEILAKAKTRLAQVQKDYPKAQLYGETEMGGMTYFYLLLESPDVYNLPIDPKTPLSLTVWKDYIQPLGVVSVGGVTAAVVVGLFANLLRGNYKSDNGDASHSDNQKGGK